ncbi:MAG: hypothetical protein ACRD15_14875, partial [Vicinamibacterales bacterium]
MFDALLPLLGLTFLLNRGAPTTDVRRVDPDFLKIRCPLCNWQPQKPDRWSCDPGCHNRWNTFETAGICPGCAKHWDETACLQCSRWSAHEAWYVHDEG